MFVCGDNSGDFQCPLGREAEGGRGRARRRTTPRRSVAGPTAAREKTKMRAKTKMSCSRPRRLRANGRQATAVLASRPRLRTRCCSRADSGRARLRTSRLLTTSIIPDAAGPRAAGMMPARQPQSAPGIAASARRSRLGRRHAPRVQAARGQERRRHAQRVRAGRGQEGRCRHAQHVRAARGQGLEPACSTCASSSWARLGRRHAQSTSASSSRTRMARALAACCASSS